MKKLEKIDRQEQKTRDKIVALQAILKQIDGARTEQENLQIIQQVRALKLSRNELYAFLGGGELPAALAGAIGGGDPAAEPDGNRLPETIYTRREKKRRREQDTATEPGADAPDNENTHGDNDAPNNESEGIKHEEQ
jgi:hypothetical protein